LIRQMLGLNPVRAFHEKPFHYKTLSENVCHVDDELLEQINAIGVQAGRKVFKKAASPSRFELKPTRMSWRPTCISRPI
jgi:hypothetical protein